LSAGTTPVLLAPVDLNPLIADLIDGLSEPAAERGLSLNPQLDPDLPPALVDRAMIARVLSNLMKNALDYTSRGGRISVITACGRRGDDEWITCAVQDTGPGLSAEEMPRLFERFYRGEAARDFITPGAGLGLAICKEIVDQLGGHITVDSQPGHGAAFIVWLKPA